MAESEALLTAGGTSSATTSGVTASVTPTANRLVLIGIVTDNGTVSSVTGNGLSWSLIKRDTTLVPMEIWGAMSGASPSAGAITIALSANSVLSWVVVEVAGTDLTNVATAIVQSAANTAAGVTSMAVNLGVGITAGNGVAAFIGHNVLEAQTAGGTYTKSGETTANGFVDWAQEFNATGTQNPSMSWATSGNSLGLAVEIKAAGGGGQTLTPAEVVETEAAQPVTLAKAAALSQAAETEAAQALTLAKTAPAAQVVETETAQSVTLGKTLVLSQVVETETVQPLVPFGTTVALGQVVETETVQPVVVTGGLQILYFRPPTVKRYFDSRVSARLMNKVPYQQGRAVLDNAGVLTPFPGLETVRQELADAATRVYYGGHIYGPLSGQEVTNLVDAGYGPAPGPFLTTTPP